MDYFPCYLGCNLYIWETVMVNAIINPLPTIGNSLKKQKSLYKVVLNPHINYYGLMGAHDAYMRH